MERAFETTVLALALSYVARLDVRTRTLVDYFAGDTGALRDVIAKTRVCCVVDEELDGLGLHMPASRLYDCIDRHWDLIEVYGITDVPRDDVIVPVFSYESMITGVEA